MENFENISAVIENNNELGESSCNNIVQEKNKFSIKYFNLEGHQERNGLLFMSSEDDEVKTNPEKLPDWFPVEFLNLHKVYAIKEEEPHLLKLFTRNHEARNRGIRSKGGKKIELLGEEVFGDTLLACGGCGYWSQEGSNVRRHLKNRVCFKERSYSREDLIGLTKLERVRFLRKVTSARARARKKALKASLCQTATNSENSCNDSIKSISKEMGINFITDNNGQLCKSDSSKVYNGNYSVGSDNYQSSELTSSKSSQNKNTNNINQLTESKRNRSKYRALKLGPLVRKDVISKISYDIYTVQDKQERIAWKPQMCHKCLENDVNSCQIVFKGARMRRRCLDLPVPIVLVYRKLDCKTHNCNFTLFHQSARQAYKEDVKAKGSINIKMYGDTVMTEEFYHYIISLLSMMKMKPCQIARHLTSVWETILASRLHVSTIPDEYRKLITLSKQTVKSIWISREESVCSIRQQRSKRKKKPAQPLSSSPSSSRIEAYNNPPINLATNTTSVLSVSLAKSHELQSQSCMKVTNHIIDKLPPSQVNSHKHPIISQSQLNSTMQPHHPHPNVPHPHWLPQNPHHQYHHNIAPYPTTPQHPDYYSMPGHFMTQYAPANLGAAPSL